jgi:hypothetical protein
MRRDMWQYKRTIGRIGAERAQRMRVDHTDGVGPSSPPVLTVRGKEAPGGAFLLSHAKSRGLNNNAAPDQYSLIPIDPPTRSEVLCSLRP